MAAKAAKGKSRKTRKRSIGKQGVGGVKQVLSEVQNSLQLLTDRVDSLEKRLRQAEFAAGIFAPEYVWNAYRQLQRRKPGQMPAYSLADLLARRNALVTFLEMNWPEIKLAILAAQSSADLQHVFQNARKPIAALVEPEFVQQPTEFLEKCWEFVKSKRYCNNPRRLADALAGLPKLSWKRSFDVCSGSRCTQAIEPRAVRDFLLRKFPQRLKELLQVHTEPEVISVLQRSRTKDHCYLQLLENPSGVLESLTIGQPRGPKATRRT
jgi:hypothetical protein